MQHLRRILDLEPFYPLLSITCCHPREVLHPLQLGIIILNLDAFPHSLLQDVGKHLRLRWLLPQVREYGGNIGAEYVVVRQNQDVLRLYGIFIVIKKIRQTVKSDAGLSAARQPVNQAGAPGVAADGRILLPLDAPNDDFQPMVGIIREDLSQNVVIHGGVCVVHGEETTVFDFILPFPRNFDICFIAVDLIPAGP